MRAKKKARRTLGYRVIIRDLCTGLSDLSVVQSGKYDPNLVDLEEVVPAGLR